MDISYVNKVFDHVFVLSLPSEMAKRESMKKKLNKLNIEFTFFDALDGQSPQFDKEWEMYNARPIREKLEKKRAGKLIQSRGAWGCLYSYRQLIVHALQMKYDKILVLEDDCHFDKKFDEKFENFINALPIDNWKMLYLGASQHEWVESQYTDTAYYYPIALKTLGAFAVGYQQDVFKMILNELTQMITAYDQKPLGNVIQNYPNQCFVANPNLIIADVSKSNIRETRDMIEHSNKMNWDLENYVLND